MKANLVRIGNSRGIRIPKAVIEECGFGETVELRVKDRRLVVVSERKPRQGWDEALRRASAVETVKNSEEDELWLNAALDEKFDREEWKW